MVTEEKEIDEQKYNNFIKDMADLIIRNNGELDYSLLMDACKKEGRDIESAQRILFASIIVKHIPLYKNKQRVERSPESCLRSAFVFNYTRIDEDAFIAYSATNDAIPTFKRHDPADDGKLHAGAGSRLADFEATTNPNIIVDMKATYVKDNTVSSYHDANHIVCPCATNHSGYAIYFLRDGKLDLSSEVLLPKFYAVQRDYPVVAEKVPAEYKSLFKNISKTLSDIDIELDFRGFV